MTIARIAAWSRRPRLSAAACRAIDWFARDASLRGRQDFAGGRRRLVGPGQDDQRVVHEAEVPAGLTAADLDERVGRRLVRVVAPEDLFEVGLHPAMPGRLGGRGEEIGIRAAGRRPVDHRAQHTRGIVTGRPGFGADEVADVPARDQGADNEAEDRHRGREEESQAAESERCNDAEGEIAAGRDLEARPSEERPRCLDPGGIGSADSKTETERRLGARRQRGHQASEDGQARGEGAD